MAAERVVGTCLLFLTLQSPVQIATSADSVSALVDSGRWREAVALGETLVAQARRRPNADSLALADALDVLSDVRIRTDVVADSASVADAALALRLRSRASGLPPGRLVTTLMNHARLSQMAGDASTARREYQHALRTLQRMPRPPRARIADVLERIGTVELEEQHFEAAEARFNSALALRRQAPGPDRQEIAQTLRNLGNLYTEQRDSTRAIATFQTAISIYERVLGPDAPEVAATLEDLATCLGNFESDDRAAPLFERALRIVEKRFGADHRRTAGALNKLAGNHYFRGDLRGALELLQRVLDVRRRVYGAEHPAIAEALGNLAVVQGNLGDVWSSRDGLLEALRLEERAYGADSPELASTCTNLGKALMETGDYAAARPHLERAVRLWQKQLGPKHPNTASALANLGSADLISGDYLAARREYQGSLESFEETLGPKSPSVARTLEVLSRILIETGHADTAVTLARRALDINRSADGDSSSRTAWSRKQLAEALRAAGDTHEAALEYSRALAIQDAAGFSDHVVAAETLRGWAALETETGALNDARSHIQRALDIVTRVLGRDHPERGAILARLAIVDLLQEQPDSALAAALEAERIGRTHLVSTIRTLPERKALAYADVRSRGLDAALSAALALSRGRGHVDASAWDALIRSRAVVMEEMASRRRVLPLASPSARASAVDLERARRLLASLSLREPKGAGDDLSRQLDSLRREVESREGALAEQSAEFRRRQVHDASGWREVASRLTGNEGIVSFARFTRYGPGMAAGEPYYVAFVAHGDDHAPRIVDLGSADRIDSMVTEWRARVSLPADGPGRGAQVRLGRRAGAALRAAVWDPVARVLGASNPITVVPDGLINLINLYALPGPGERDYLVDKGPVIRLVSTERDLLDSPLDRPASVLLALGAPDYDATPDQTLAETVAPAEAVSSYRGSLSHCPSISALRWRELPWTRLEVEAIADIWRRYRRSQGGSATVLVGARANEANFKRLAHSARVLHIATHGFFLSGECGSPGARSLNPLFDSGLVLAAANTRNTVPDDAEDGVLTAEEVASLDLSGVEWAVLSACETGLGEFRGAEGLFGLRRAFGIAGARNVVMSLWPVDDQITVRWMKRLYAERWTRRRSTAESAREATRTALRECRRRGGHPFEWAGFVASGVGDVEPGGGRPR